MDVRWAIAAVAIPLGGIVVACNALTSVGEYTYDGECRVDADCDDGNPCTVGVCSSRLCSHEPTSAAPPPIRGNCSEESCEGGAIVFVKDLGDQNDGDPCTDDYCPDTGGPLHVPKSSGDGCSIGPLTGSCHGGDCEVPCQTPGGCDLEDPCVTGTCAGQVCVFAERDAGTSCGPDGGTCSPGGFCE